MILVPLAEPPADIDIDAGGLSVGWSAGGMSAGWSAGELARSEVSATGLTTSWSAGPLRLEQQES